MALDIISYLLGKNASGGGSTEGVYKVSSTQEMLSIENPQEDYYCIVSTIDDRTGLYQYYSNSWHTLLATPGELPLDYTQLDYIIAQGYEYIDTGFKPNQDTKVTMSVGNCSKAAFFFGAWNVQWNDGAYSVCNDGGGVYAGYDGQSIAGEVQDALTGDHIVEMDKNVVKIDGNVDRTFTYTNFQVNYNLYLGAQNRIGTPTWRLANGDRAFDIKYCKIYDNGTLIRDYVPCYRNSDKKPGLFDLKNGQFYTNQASNSEFKIPEDINNFTQLNYLQSTGTQYINSYYYPSNSTILECKYETTNTIALHGVYGLISNSSKYYAYCDADVNGNVNNKVFYFKNNTNTSTVVGYTYPIIVKQDGYSYRLQFNTGGATAGTLSGSGNFYADKPCYLFAHCNSSGNAIHIGKTKIYYFKISESDYNIYNFIPVKRNSNNELGFYDTIHKFFLKNNGTGTFNFG